MPEPSKELPEKGGPKPRHPIRDLLHPKVVDHLHKAMREKGGKKKKPAKPE